MIESLSMTEEQFERLMSKLENIENAVKEAAFNAEDISDIKELLEKAVKSKG